MISIAKIKELATKYQTTELNVIREYFQHLFLSYFYQQSTAGSIYFKGGTAMRTIYRSPRFSEDLDFSAHKLDVKDLEQAILSTLDAVEKENVTVSLREAKTTSGGYLADIVFESPSFQRLTIQLEISFRKGNLRGNVTTISSDYTLPYTINGLALDQLVDEKIQALFFRKKPRDFYDLYFILRSNLLPPAKKGVLQEALKILKKTDINFENELKIFLPKSHWAIIRDFKSTLEGEIQRFGNFYAKQYTDKP